MISGANEEQLELANARADILLLQLDMFKNQQKEFIEYLENMLDNENDIFSVVRAKDVLSKYKEITGQQDGQQSGQV